MIRPSTISIEKDGPRVALKRMREESISSIFVVNRHRELIGMVHAKEVLDLINEKKSSLEEIIHRDIVTTEPDTPIADLMDTVSTMAVPMAVIENNKLKGIIVRGSVLAALAGNEVPQHV